MKLCLLTYGHIYDLWKLYTFLDPQSRVCLNAREATEKRDSEDVHRMEKEKRICTWNIFFALELSQKNRIFVGEWTYSIYHESKEGWFPFVISQGY